MKLSFAVSMQQTDFASVANGNWHAIADEMAGLGYNGLELAIQNPFLTDAAELDGFQNKTGLTICAIGTGQAYFDKGLSLSSPDREKQKSAVSYLKRHIELAAGRNALVIIGLIRGRLSDHCQPSEALASCARSLQDVNAYAKKLDVTLAIEPINRYETDFLHTSHEAARFIKDNDLTATGILLDTFHMNIEEHDFETAINDACPLLKHVHVADSNRRYPGSGHLDFSKIINMILKSGYTEFFSGEMAPEPDLKTATVKYYQFMRNRQ